MPAGEGLGRRNLGHIVRTVPARKGLAVIADFADARLEDWRGPGIRSVAQLQAQLQRVEQREQQRASSALPGRHDANTTSATQIQPRPLTMLKKKALNAHNSY